MKCRHDGCPYKADRGRRGLCQRCHKAPAVRALYPMTDSKYARRGVGSGVFSVPPAAEPTAHPPGSPGKIEVLMGRARAGTALFHPNDNPFFLPVEKELAG